MDHKTRIPQDFKDMFRVALQRGHAEIFMPPVLAAGQDPNATAKPILLAGASVNLPDFWFPRLMQAESPAWWVVATPPLLTSTLSRPLPHPLSAMPDMLAGALMELVIRPPESADATTSTPFSFRVYFDLPREQDLKNVPFLEAFLTREGHSYFHFTVITEYLAVDLPSLLPNPDKPRIFEIRAGRAERKPEEER